MDYQIKLYDINQPVYFTRVYSFVTHGPKPPNV